MIYYAIALINDFVRSTGTTGIRDYMLASLALPLALKTSLLYWSLRLVDRELVFPESFDAFYPVWLDIMLHANISIFILVEVIFISNIKYPARKIALSGLMTFLLGYLIWLHIIKFNTGMWVYGILDSLNLSLRILFFLGSGLITVGLYFVGEAINKFTVDKKRNEKKYEIKIIYTNNCCGTIVVNTMRNRCGKYLETQQCSMFSSHAHSTATD